LDIKGFKCYWNQQLLPGGCIIERAGFVSISDVPIKSHHCTTSLQYLGKYVFVRHETSSGKFYCKLSRKQPISNSLETALGWLNFDIGNVFCIIVRSELKLRNLVQYFFVLRKSIFLHFPSIWNKVIEIVSARIIFNQLNYVNKNLDIKGFLYYKSEIQAQMLLSSATFAPGGLFPSLTSPLKSHHCTTFLQYLGKYVFVRRETRKFWKVPWQTNLNLLNKWPLQFAFAYLNTQESSPSRTQLKRLQDGWRNVFYIILRYWMNLRSLVQYLFVLCNRQVSLPSLTSPLKSHLCTTFLQYLGKYTFVRCETRKFWKVPWQTNLNLLNKWPLIFACAYLNTQESSPSGTPLKRLQDG
ncbi:hypothetical protein T06_11321, partial [Trichinella sp. T6]